MNAFEGFPKIARLNREMVITEKIDGTNAQIYIGPRSEAPSIPPVLALTDDWFLCVGSRTKWVVPGDDNHGFAKWALKHAEELLTLGPGRHFGEWWGSGIQRGYGLQKGEKRFSLFNTTRWNTTNIPACVSVVPELFRGDFSSVFIEYFVEKLRKDGSEAVPGFMRPEGIVVFHTASNQLFKVTLEKDEMPKSRVVENAAPTYWPVH
jgi:hypothetical protein